MSGNSYLIDTNIAIYLLSGDPKIAGVLDQNQIYIICKRIGTVEL